MAVLNAEVDIFDSNLLKGLKDAAENSQPMLAIRYAYRLIEIQEEKIKQLEEKLEAAIDKFDVSQKQSTKPQTKTKEPAGKIVEDSNAEAGSSHNE